MTDGKPPASRARTAAFWLLALLMLLSPIGLAELYLRYAIGLGDPILYVTGGDWRYVPRPNQHNLRRRGAWVTIDSAGLRDTRDWHGKADQHILFVGDSVTWGGTGVDDRDTFAEVACANLRKATGRDMLCGNAGVNSYGTDNMRARLQYGGITGEDALVVTAIADDTVRGMADFKGLPFFAKPPHGPLKALWEASGILSMRLASMLMKQPTWQTVHDLPMAGRSLDALFAELHRQEDAGRLVLLVYSPYAWDITGTELPYDTEIRRRMANSGLPFLDMTEIVRAHYAPDFYVDGVHLDVKGNAVYGAAIADRLAEMYKTRQPG